MNRAFGALLLGFALCVTLAEGLATPAAQSISYPPGWYNNNGKGGLNLTCIPFADQILGTFLGGATPNVSHPSAWYVVLQAPVTGGHLGKYETPVAFHKASYIHAAAWSALAPYHPTAKPILQTGIERRPTEEHTTENANIAMIYAMYRVVESLLPEAVQSVDFYMNLFGLDTEDMSTDTTTPVGIGNTVAAVALDTLAKDGMNALGDDTGNIHPRLYQDYTAFVPLNSPTNFENITKWQPLLETDGRGYFVGQVHITPQISEMIPLLGLDSMVETFSPGSDPNDTLLPPPYSDELDMTAYQAQAQEVLDVSANLTDEQKMLAEYFDAKFTSFGVLSFLLLDKPEATLAERVGAELHVNCMMEGFQLAWSEKIKHNAVRPVSAIQHLYQGQNVTAYAGNGKGTQSFPGESWLSYLRTMPHADYPSGTACICAVFSVGATCYAFLKATSLHLLTNITYLCRNTTRS